jgi:hypothetical protein
MHLKTATIKKHGKNLGKKSSSRNKGDGAISSILWRHNGMHLEILLAAIIQML